MPNCEGDYVSRIASSDRALRGLRIAAVLGAVLSCSLVLGACSKCDVPNLTPNQAAPRACHDGPSPQ
jgi:hypothetical protein